MFEHAEGIITFPKLRRNMRALFVGGFFFTRAWDFTMGKCKEGFIHVATAKKKLTQWGFNWMIHGNFHPKMGNIFLDICLFFSSLPGLPHWKKPENYFWHSLIQKRSCKGRKPKPEFWFPFEVRVRFPKFWDQLLKRKGRKKIDRC